MSPQSDRVLTVGVLDDEEGLSRQWADEVRSTLNRVGIRNDVTSIPWQTSDRAGLVSKLRESQESFVRAQSEGVSWSPEETIFDDLDVLFIDYKLFDGDQSDVKLTGLELAYLVRAYSGCKIIVALNSQGGMMRAQKHFDLTLREASSRLENLHITTRDIADPGLWSDSVDVWNAYRPWSWPLLQQEALRYEKRLELARRLLGDEAAEKPLVEALGFVGDLVYNLPSFAIDHLGRGVNATSRDFLWQSGNVLRGEDVAIDHNEDKRTVQEKILRNHVNLGQSAPCVRLMAAAIHRWLERMVLPAQDVLIDRPHLLSRWPGLNPGDSGDLESATAWAIRGLSAVDPLVEDEINRFAYEPSVWLSRPVYRWSDMQEDEAFADEIRGRHGPGRSNLVFQEDASRFAPAAESKAFRCDYPSLSAIRYCSEANFERAEVAYEPESRFAE